MEHSPSKRMKLSIDSCKTNEWSIEKNAAQSSILDLLKHRNEFTQETGYCIDSFMEKKPIDGKTISSNAAEQERFTFHEYGFEKDSTNCDDHSSELMVPAQLKKHIKMVNYPRSQYIPSGTEDKASESKLMLFGYKSVIQDNELTSNISMESEQVLGQSMILSGITVGKVKTQEKSCSKSVCSFYNFDSVLTCDPINLEGIGTSDIYNVERVRVGRLQNQKEESKNMKQGAQELRRGTLSNYITMKHPGNATMDNKKFTLSVPFTSKYNGIQNDSMMISQTEALISDLETNARQVYIQTSCLLETSTLNENANDIDTQKMAIVCLENASSKNSSDGFVEKIPFKRKNENNLSYRYDIVDRKESSKVQIHEWKQTCRVTKKAPRIVNPLTVNKFIGIHEILNFKYNIVGASKAVIELIYGSTSINIDTKMQAVYRKQSEEAFLIIQLQLPKEKQGYLKQKLLEISNCKGGYYCDLNSSQMERKLEMLGATSMTRKIYLKKDGESFCDALHESCSDNAESQDSMLLNVGIILKDLVHSSGIECQPGNIFFSSFEAYEKMSKRIFVYKNACDEESDRNTISENEGEHELIFMAKPDFLFVESNVLLSEDHSGNLMQTEYESQIEISSTSNDSVKDYVDSSGTDGVSLCACESEEPKDTCVMEIPSTFTVNSILKGSGLTNISSEKINKGQSDSIVIYTKGTGVDISEREAECQMKYLWNTHYVKDWNCDFQTENTIHYSDVCSTYIAQSDWTSILKQFSTPACSLSDWLQFNTSRNTLLYSQKTGLLDEIQTNNLLDTTFNKVNNTKEITMCVPNDTSIHQSVACNLLKNTGVTNFLVKGGECYLKDVTSLSSLQGTDNKMQSSASKLKEAISCLQDDKGQSFNTECLNNVCSLTSDNVLSCTASVPVKADIQMSLAKIEENRVSAVMCQQKYVSKSQSMTHTNHHAHKEVNALYGIPHLDNSFRSQSESSVLDVATKKNTALSMVENNPHFNNGEEVLNEQCCTKTFTTIPSTQKSIADKITNGFSENGNIEAAISSNVNEISKKNNCSESKAEYHLKCLTMFEQFGGYANNMDAFTVNELHPVSSLASNTAKECEFGCANETAQFSSVCSLTKDDISLTSTADLLVGEQNKLVDEHLAFPTSHNEGENSSDVTNVFKENSSLTNYPRITMNNISKREMESFHKCEYSCNHFKQSDIDLHGKLNVLYTASHFNTENTQDSQTDFSHNVRPFSFCFSSSKDTASLSSPEDISPLKHVNEILEERQNVDTFSTDPGVKNKIEENAMISVSKYMSFQIPLACNSMLEDISINDPSNHFNKPVNGQSCFLNSSNNLTADLAKEFQETSQFEPAKMHVTQIKCIEKAQCYNICNSFKDCSGLTSTVNTSQHLEMAGGLEGCNGRKKTTVTFSIDLPVKGNTEFPHSNVEGNSTLIKSVNEKNKQPGIKNKCFSRTTASAFDCFEKYTLSTDTEEQDTVTLIRKNNCCNKETHNEGASIIKQIIHNNDNNSNEALSLQMSSSKSSSAECCQSSINNTNSGETKDVIPCEQDKKEYSNIKLPVKFQNRTKEDSMYCVQLSEASLKNYELDSAPDQVQQHTLDHKQVHKESIMDENNENSQQLSGVIISNIQNDTQQVVSVQTSGPFAWTNGTVRCDSIIGHGRTDYFEQINSTKGSTIPSVAEECFKTQITISNNEIPNFEMREQFSAVLKELCLFHEISKQSEWAERVSEDHATELVNERKDVVMVPQNNDIMNNSHVGQMHNNLQPFTHTCVKADEKDHDCFIRQEALQDTLSKFAKTLSVTKGEQEVPMTIEVSEIDDEESLYIPHKVSEFRSHGSREAKVWSPAFNFEINNTRTTGDSKIGSYLSNGLPRIEPLKTCSGPIRIGLSKRIKTKHLHPYLR